MVAADGDARDAHVLAGIEPKETDGGRKSTIVLCSMSSSLSEPLVTSSLPNDEVLRSEESSEL